MTRISCGKKPFLCRVGLHRPYHYLPKVGGDLGETSTACKRCGYGHRYFTGAWDIPPEEVQRAIEVQAVVEYGRILGFLSGINDPETRFRTALSIMEEGGKFTDEELKPLRKVKERR